MLEYSVWVKREPYVLVLNVFFCFKDLAKDYSPHCMVDAGMYWLDGGSALL